MKLNDQNSFCMSILLLLIPLFLVGVSPKVQAQVLNTAIKPASTPNGPVEMSEGDTPLEPATTAADLQSDPSTLTSAPLSSAFTPEAIAQGTTEPLPETPAPEAPKPEPSTSESAGEAPRLRTEPVSPDELPFQPRKDLLQRSVRYSPGITYLTPSAYGKSWGQFSVGGSFQSRVRFGTESDASFGGGIGFGNARKTVGLDVSINIADVTNFERGSIGFKLHRRLPAQFAVAVGVENAIRWGAVGGGVGPYGVITKSFQLREDPKLPFSQLYLSGGAGTGRFRSEGDIINDRNSVGVFGSVAVRVIEQMNFITEWSGQDLTLAVSVLPFPKFPLVLTPAVTDVTGTAGDGPRFAFAVGLGFTF
jgi:hypothetical protein